MASGDPFLKNGIQVGLTDFSEFSVAAGLPSGITEYGITPTSPPTLAIANDVTEGNYFSMTGQGFKSWGFGLDSFDGGLMLTGELLARVWMDIPADGRKGIGPAANMLGLIGQSVGGADFDNWCGSFYHPPGADESGAFSTTLGSTFNTLTGALQEALQDEVWAWVRVRRLLNGANPGTQDDWTITAWFGAIGDEPASPDAVVVGSVRSLTFVAAAIGWAMPSTGANADQRIAFLSFSADPVLAAPPIPGESSAIWEPCDPAPTITPWVP